MRIATPTFVLLVALTVFCATDARAQYGDRIFEDETIESGTYEAGDSIKTRNATVESGSDVVFRAGEGIRLEAGTRIEAGATFRAEIDPDSEGGELVLSDLPPNTYNDRLGYEDVFKNHIFRPFLSVRGFDSDRFADGGDYGLGLKQILYRVYNEDNQLASSALERIITDTNTALVVTPDNSLVRSGHEDNTRILQARAFVALATYVLEQNGVSIDALNPDNPDIPLPTHAEALGDFREPWREMGDDYTLYDFHIDIENHGDPVQWTTTTTNLARAVDLYLALENAYDYYGGAGRADYNDPTQRNS